MRIAGWIEEVVGGRERRHFRAFAVVAVLAAGCSAGAASFAANPQLTPYAWGVRFTSSNPAVSFPLPAGWVFVSVKTAPAQPDTVRLQSADGACQVLLTRAPAVQKPAAAGAALEQALAAAGRRVMVKGTQQVGNVQAQRLDAVFDKGVSEQMYTMQRGPWLLTLITVHGARCRTSFDDTLRGFRM